MLQRDYQTDHIDVLDGVRALAILIVVWFHFWQQSWLMPIVGDFNIDWIPRNDFTIRLLPVSSICTQHGIQNFRPYCKDFLRKARSSYSTLLLF